MNLTHCATHGRSWKSESPTHGATTLYFRLVSRIHETGLTLLKIRRPLLEKPEIHVEVGKTQCVKTLSSDVNKQKNLNTS